MTIKPIIYNKATKFLRIFFLSIFFVSFLYPQGSSADSISDKRRELEAIQQKIDAQSRILSKKTQERKTLANQVAIMNGQIAQTQYSINKTQVDISLTEAEIAKLKSQIKKKKIELAYQKEILNETLREVYTETDKGFLEVLFSTNNISEVFDNTEYLGAIESKISLTMDEINKIKTALNNDKKEQETKKTDKESLLAQQEATRSSLGIQMNNRAKLLAQTKGQESAYQAQLAKIQQIYNSTNSELKSMEIAASGGGSDAPSMSGFYWPTRGYIPRGGYFCDPSYSYHTCHSGIDIATGGASPPVVASKDGEVVRVVDGFGNTYPDQYIYGNFVVIDHGNGFLSFYGHLAKGMIRVHVGQRVNGGSTRIGYVDNSGFSTGPHLHFEIRYNNRPVNPLKYLP